MNYNIFKGEKIRLRAKTLADLDRSYVESSDYDTEMDRLCDEIHLPHSFDGRKDNMENEVRMGNSWDRCDLVIETIDGTAVGGICTAHADRTSGTFSYGIGIKRDCWRKGYASEAIKLFLNYYFNELRFHKCNVSVFDYNEASKQLHLSIGFIEEGKQRESKFTDGKYHDVLFFGITAEEYNSQKTD